MFFLAVDLLYDLVPPHIDAADFPLLDFADAGDPLYQYRKKPLSPDLARSIQGGGGTGWWLVPHKGLDLFHSI